MEDTGSTYPFPFESFTDYEYLNHNCLVDLRREALKNSQKLYEDFLKKQKGIADSFNYTSINQTVSEFSAFWEKNKDKIFIDLKKDNLDKLKKKYESQSKEYNEFETKMIAMVGNYATLEKNYGELLSHKILSEAFMTTILKFKKFQNRRSRILMTITLAEDVMAASGMCSSLLKGKKFKEKNVTQLLTKLAGYSAMVDKFVNKLCDSYKNKLPGIYAYLEEFDMERTKLVESLQELLGELKNLTEKTKNDLSTIIENLKTHDKRILENIMKYKMFLDELKDERHYFKTVKKIRESGLALFDLMKPFEYGLTEEELKELELQLGNNQELIETYSEYEVFFSSSCVKEKVFFGSKLKEAVTELTKSLHGKVMERVRHLKEVHSTELAVCNFYKNIEVVASSLLSIKDVVLNDIFEINIFELSRATVNSIIIKYNNTTTMLLKLKEDFLVISTSGHICISELKKLLNKNIILNKEVRPLVWKLREAEEEKVMSDIREEFTTHMEDWIKKLEKKIKISERKITDAEESEVYVEVKASAQIIKGELVAIHKMLEENGQAVVMDNREQQERYNNPHKERTISLYKFYDDIKKMASEFFWNFKIIKSKRTFSREADKIDMKIKFYMKKVETVYASDVNILAESLEAYIRTIKNNKLENKFVKLEDIEKIFKQRPDILHWAQARISDLISKLKHLKERITGLDEYLNNFKLYQQTCASLLTEKFYFESLGKMLSLQPLGSSKVRCQIYFDILKEIMSDSKLKVVECERLIKKECIVPEDPKYFPARYFKEILCKEYENLRKIIKNNKNLLKRALSVHSWNKEATEHCFTLKELMNYVNEYRTTYKPIHYIDFLQRISYLQNTLEDLEKISQRLISESEALEFPYSKDYVFSGIIVEGRGTTHHMETTTQSAKDYVYIKINDVDNDGILVTDGCELYIFNSKDFNESEHSNVKANDLMRKFPTSNAVQQRIIEFTEKVQQIKSLLILDDADMTQRKLDMEIISKLKYLKYWIEEKNGFLLELRRNIKDPDDYSLAELSKLQHHITEQQHFLEVNKEYFRSIEDKQISSLHSGLEKLLDLLQTVRNELDVKATICLLKNEFRHIEFRYGEICINCNSINSLLANASSFKPLQSLYERESFHFNALKQREKIAVHRCNNFSTSEKELFDASIAKMNRLKALIEKLLSQLEKNFQDAIVYGKQIGQLDYIEKKIDSEKLNMMKREQCDGLFDVQALLAQLENLSDAEFKGINSELERSRSEVQSHSLKMKSLETILEKKIDSLFLEYEKLISLKDDRETYLKNLCVLYRYFNDIESFKYWQTTKIEFSKDLISKNLKIDKENIGWMIKGFNIQCNKLDTLDSTRKQLVSYFEDRKDEINQAYESALLLFNELKYILEHNFAEERTEYCIEDVYEEIEELHAWFEDKYTKVKVNPSSNIDNIYLLIRNHKILKTEYTAKNEQLMSISKTAENVDNTASISDTLNSYKELHEISRKLSERIEVYNDYYGVHSTYFEIVKQLSIMKHRMSDIADKLSDLELREEESELYKAIILMETFLEDLKEIRVNMDILKDKAGTLTVEAKMKEELTSKFSESFRALLILEKTTYEYEKIIETYKLIDSLVEKVNCHNNWLNEKLMILENLFNSVDLRFLDSVVMNLTNIEKEFMLYHPVVLADIKYLENVSIQQELLKHQKMLKESYSRFKKLEAELKKNLNKLKKLLKEKQKEMDAYTALNSLFGMLNEEYIWFSQMNTKFESKNIGLQTREYVENERKAFPEFKEQLVLHLKKFEELSENIQNSKVQNNKVDKLLVLTTNQKNHLLASTNNFMMRCDERIGVLKIIAEINALSAWLMDAERSLEIKYDELDEENILKAYEKLLQVKKIFDAFERNEYLRINDTFKAGEFLSDLGSVTEKKESLNKRWNNFSDKINDLLNKLSNLNEGRYNIKSLLINFANEASDFGEMYDRVTEALAVSLKQLSIDDFKRIQEETDLIIPSQKELEKMLNSLRELNDTIQQKVGDVENPHTFDTIDTITEMYKALATQIKEYRREVEAEKKIHAQRAKLCEKHIKIVEKIEENLYSIRSKMAVLSGTANEKLAAIVKLEEKLAHNGKMENKMLSIRQKLSEIGVYSNPLCIDDPAALIREMSRLSKTINERRYGLNLQLALEKLVGSLSSQECEALSESFLKEREKRQGNVKVSDLGEILKSSNVDIDINIQQIDKIFQNIGIDSNAILTHELFVLVASHKELNIHEKYIEDFKAILPDSSHNSISEYELYQGLGHELAEFCLDHMKPAEASNDPFNASYDITEFCKRFFI